MLRVAVVGACGATGRLHLEAYRRAGARLAYLVDPDPAVKVLARRHGATPLRDARELPTGDLDAATLSLPPALHPRAAARLLEASVGVLCEKPLAQSARAAAPLIVAAARRGARFMAGFQLRFDPAFQRLREEIRRGRLGQVIGVRVDKAHALPPGPWRLERGGGVTRIKDVHYYDLIPWLTGRRPVRAWALGGALYHGGRAEDATHVMLELDEGVAAQLRGAWWPFPHRLWAFEVMGTAAFATYDGRRLVLHDASGEPEVVRLAKGEDPLVRQARAFLRYVEQGGRSPTPLADGLAAVAVADAVRRSLRTGRPVRVEDAGDAAG
ncbi:MAG TPA: Gfo/Idh/MocA family oxidoreductase [Longimicrobiales bacterium]|nr:Gfo/Idh/MocA family oxidoreductase [Longimicrobiales bacterium]